MADGFTPKHFATRALGAAVRAALPLGALALLSGCRMNEAVYHPDGSRIIYMRPPLMNVIDELDVRHKSARTVFARMNVTLRDTVKNKEYPLEAVYLGDKDGNMRLRMTAENHLILDMGTRGENVDIWLPRKERYFRGKRDDLLGNSTSQLSLLAHLGGACDVLFPRAWTKSAVERRVVTENGREVVSVLEKSGLGLTHRRVRRLAILPNDAAVESMAIYDKSGKEVGLVNYSDYRYPERPGDNEIPLGGLTGMVYPGKLLLTTKTGAQTLELAVDTLELNPPISLDKFEVPLPEDTKVLDLESALKQNGSLWE